MQNRYFIVIDDIWSTTDWQTIRCVLLDSNIGKKFSPKTNVMAKSFSCQDKVLKENLTAFYWKFFPPKKIFGVGEVAPLIKKGGSNGY